MEFLKRIPVLLLILVAAARGYSSRTAGFQCNKRCLPEKLYSGSYR